MSKISLSPSVVAIYCASSTSVDPAIFAAGKAIGEALTKAGLGMVYGGPTCGLMGITSEAHKNAGGRVIGVVPSFMIEAGIKSPLLDEVVAVESMADRKNAMNQRSGAFVILPGGIGTFDEFFDILALKQLNQHQKPIVLVNTLGYYEPLLAMLRHCVKHHTVKEEHLTLFSVANTPEEVMVHLSRSAPAPLSPNISPAK